MDELDKETKDKFENMKIDIIGHFRELQLKRNKFGLGYEKNEANLFHITDYSRLVTFVHAWLILCT